MPTARPPKPVTGPPQFPTVSPIRPPGPPTVTKSTSLLVDGSALFLSSRAIETEHPLDYRRLAQKLMEKLKVESFRPAIFFTSFDSGNEGQLKFLNFIRDMMAWQVEAVPFSEAALMPQSERDASRPYVRFDSRIAFSLGRLAGRSNVVVVSDAYSLASPILETARRGSNIALAFFSRALDPRWLKHLRDARSGIQFIDLDLWLDELFGGNRSETSSGSAFSLLP